MRFADQPLGNGFLPDLAGVDAPAIVDDLNHDVVAFLRSLQLDIALFRLAGRFAFGRRLQAVINRVANNMHQRIRDVLDNQLVQFGIRPADFEIDPFTLLIGNPPDNPGHLVKQLPDRNHADIHDPFLQFVQAALQNTRCLAQLRGEFFFLGSLEPITDIGNRALRQDELTNDVHEQIELVDIHPHGTADRAQRTAAVLGIQRRRCKLNLGCRQGCIFRFLDDEFFGFINLDIRTAGLNIEAIATKQFFYIGGA